MVSGMSDFPVIEASNQNKIAEDIIVPFAIEGASNIEGRIIRLGSVLNGILYNRKYPEPVAILLAELLTLTAFLGATLGGESTVSIQISGDSSVNFMISDCAIDGQLRGYAGVDKDKFAALERAGKVDNTIKTLIGKGNVVITIDYGKGSTPSQGVIELSGESFSECFVNYFRDSVQMDVDIKTFVQSEKGKKWRSGSLIIQRSAKNIAAVATEEEEADEQDAWDRARLFLSSVTKKELLDLSLPLHDVLFRLFHEDGVRVFEPKKVHGGCRCSRKKITTMLQAMAPETIEEMKVDGVVKVKCQFCNTTEEFSDL